MSATDSNALSTDELHRYSRHLLLPGVGKLGQESLKKARVLIVGAGGLGSPAALYLAAAGVGTIGVVDDDIVSISNLQRQVLYSSEDRGLSKAETAASRLKSLNPEVEVNPSSTKFTRTNAQGLVSDYDLVLDGTDSFDSRYVIANACTEAKIPHLYAGIFRFEGQLALFEPGGPCYACLFPQPPEASAVPNCSEAGVLGPLAGVLGSLQALETLKYFLKLRESQHELILFDGLTLTSRSLKLKRRLECHVCGTGSATADFWSKREPPETRKIHSLAEAPAHALFLDVRNEEEITELPLPTTYPSIQIPLSELTTRLSELDPSAVYVTVCRSGQRSDRAQGLLLEAGFKTVYNLKSGLSG